MVTRKFSGSGERIASARLDRSPRSSFKLLCRGSMYPLHFLGRERCYQVVALGPVSCYQHSTTGRGSGPRTPIFVLTRAFPSAHPAEVLTPLSHEPAYALFDEAFMLGLPEPRRTRGPIPC